MRQSCCFFSTAIVFVILLTMPLVAQEGYWQLQMGGAAVAYGPRDSNQREWDAQGTTVLVQDASPTSAIIQYSATIAYKLNRMTYKAEWKPPDMILPGEVIPVTVTTSVIELNYGRADFPLKFEVALCQWQGFGGPVELTQLQAIPATKAGQSFTNTNSTIRARRPDPGWVGGAAKLVCSLATNFSGGLRATLPYVWVGRTPPPTTSIPAPGAPAAPLGAGTWNVEFNGYKGTMELSPGGGGWRGRFNIGSGWEEMVNLRISGTSIIFDRVAGNQHYDGKIADGGMSGAFTYEGRPYRWSATQVPPPEPVRTGSGPLRPITTSTGERVLFFNGNDGGVSNGGKSPAMNLSAPATITYIMTYHWNDGRGAPKGGTVTLLHESGTMYGPWPVSVVNNVYWEARPNVQIPAGRFQVIDSEPATWAQNGLSQGFGHVRIRGY